MEIDADALARYLVQVEITIDGEVGYKTPQLT